MKVSVVLIVILLGLQHVQLRANGTVLAPRAADDIARSPTTLQEAQRFFYNGDYDTAATATLALCAARPDDLAACELRTSTLLFQIKKALGEQENIDKTTAWKLCAACPALMSAFLAETVRGQTLARARLEINPDHEDTLFFLGKLDLNYVWLQLGTLGRKTQVVETGGSDFFVQAEAMFALWDMQVREREVPGAVDTARMLARDFPENRELRRFLTIHAPAAVMTSPGHNAP